MNTLRQALAAPWLTLLFKLACYSVGVLFCVTPLAGLDGQIAALVAIPLGLAASAAANRFRLRSRAVAILSLAMFALAMWASPLLGSPEWLSRWLGAQTVLTVIAVATFGLLSLATVFGLRTLASRWPLMAAVEGVAILAAVVVYFVGHRGSNLGQPRMFADGALAAGYDPRLILRVIGVLAIGVVGLLMLQARRAGRTLASAAALCLLLVGAFYASSILLPDYVRAEKRDEGTSNAAGTPEEDNGVSFRPDDWPKNPTPMAIATMLDDYKPVSGSFYFRQNTYSQFNGKKLVRAVDGADADVPREFAVDKTEFPCGPFVEKLEVKVPMTISLITPHARPIGLTNVKSLEPRPNANPQSFERTYFVESQALNKLVLSPEIVVRKCEDSTWSAAQREHYLHSPADPRYRALAEQILAENTRQTVAAAYRDASVIKAMAIRRWIEKNMTYFLQADHSKAEDPVASFLFGTRKGYCVHVAHAMTYLLRSAGIPSRVATGYCVEAGRPGTGSGILMTATDLHAWCEVYIDGLGWVVADAALENSLSPPPPQPDAALQQFFNEHNRKKLKPSFDQRDDNSTNAEGESNWHLAVLLIVPLIVLTYAVKLWRRYAPYWTADAKLYRIGYRAIADRLAEVGLTRQFGETREEFAERLARWAPEFVDATSAHVRQAVTGQGVQSRAAWLQRKRHLRARIKATFTLRRRLLGAMNPLSWLAVR